MGCKIFTYPCTGQNFGKLKKNCLYSPLQPCLFQRHCSIQNPQQGCDIHCSSDCVANHWPQWCLFACTDMLQSRDWGTGGEHWSSGSASSGSCISEYRYIFWFYFYLFRSPSLYKGSFLFVQYKTKCYEIELIKKTISTNVPLTSLTKSS